MEFYKYYVLFHQINYNMIILKIKIVFADYVKEQQEDVPVSIF